MGSSVRFSCSSPTHKHIRIGCCCRLGLLDKLLCLLSIGEGACRYCLVHRLQGDLRDDLPDSCEIAARCRRCTSRTARRVGRCYCLTARVTVQAWKKWRLPLEGRSSSWLSRIYIIMLASHKYSAESSHQSLFSSNTHNRHLSHSPSHPEIINLSPPPLILKKNTAFFLQRSVSYQP